MDAFELTDKLKALDIDNCVMYAANSEAFLNDVISANREQFKKGKNANGGKIGKYHMQPYVFMKHRMNPIPGLWNVDLMLTHEFERQMFAKVRGDGILIDSYDWKSDILKTWYGNEIFGVNADEISTPVYSMTVEFMKKYQYETGL